MVVLLFWLVQLDVSTYQQCISFPFSQPFFFPSAALEYDLEGTDYDCRPTTFTMYVDPPSIQADRPHFDRISGTDRAFTVLRFFRGIPQQRTIMMDYTVKLNICW